MSTELVNFTGNLAVESTKNVIGLNKLKNKIDVLIVDTRSLPNYHVSRLIKIRVFEDQNPFLLQNTIHLKEIEDPADIASSEKDNCLYVSDTKGQSVW